MLLPSYFSASSMPQLRPRQSANTHNTHLYVIFISLIALLILIGLIIFGLRRLRVRHPTPKLIPTQYLKNKWTNWHIPRYGPASYHAALGTDSTYDPGMAQASVNRRAARSSNSGVAGVDRNTSVRSVMTLPAYNPHARDGEQILGREGERDGIDVVLEMRTAEEEEELRNAEMEQLFQIRQLRRNWNAQREERRVRRREARERGDVAVLEQLRIEARQVRDNDELDELRRMLEDIKSERNSHVSVVSYADIGVARHDGTRVRESGTDGQSEQIGLLSDAGSMAEGGGREGPRNRAGSLTAWSIVGRRHRHSGSIGSALSVETNLPSPGITRSRANSRTSRDGSPRAGSASHSRRASGAPSPVPGDVVEVDLGDMIHPPNSPPRYESGGNTPVDEAPPGYISRGQSLSQGGLASSDSRRRVRGDGLPQIVVESSRPAS